MKIISFSTEPMQNPEWQAVAPERILHGTPREAFKILHAQGPISTGLYECTPGAWRINYAEEDEFCTLIEGHLRLINADGAAQEYKAPDSFFIPRGFRGVWEAVTPLRKFFVIHESKTS